MPPDLLLQCSVCGAETVWDTEALPPVGLPEVGDPVRWFCSDCGLEVRHHVLREVLIPDKLHHDICIATEQDRATVDRVMAEVARRRELPGASRSGEDIGDACRVPADTVRAILAAATDWQRRRGYLPG
ncbi:MAG TPA: hypothetical protein VMG58_08125 [Candidatus Sulfotelmatobacter sp.]|nr:hypothetical protein [Candidatus Sulfotelmatobacter sp.]